MVKPNYILPINYKQWGLFSDFHRGISMLPLMLVIDLECSTFNSIQLNPPTPFPRTTNSEKATNKLICKPSCMHCFQLIYHVQLYNIRLPWLNSRGLVQIFCFVVLFMCCHIYAELKLHKEIVKEVEYSYFVLYKFSKG